MCVYGSYFNLCVNINIIDLYVHIYTHKHNQTLTYTHISQQPQPHIYVHVLMYRTDVSGHMTYTNYVHKCTSQKYIYRSATDVYADTQTPVPIILRDKQRPILGAIEMPKTHSNTPASILLFSQQWLIWVAIEMPTQPGVPLHFSAHSWTSWLCMSGAWAVVTHPEIDRDPCLRQVVYYQARLTYVYTNPNP